MCAHMLPPVLLARQVLGLLYLRKPGFQVGAPPPQACLALL